MFLRSSVNLAHAEAVLATSKTRRPLPSDKRIDSYRASPNKVTRRSIVDPLRRKDFATVWLSLHSTSLCSTTAIPMATRSGAPRARVVGIVRLRNLGPDLVARAAPTTPPPPGWFLRWRPGPGVAMACGWRRPPGRPSAFTVSFKHPGTPTTPAKAPRDLQGPIPVAALATRREASRHASQHALHVSGTVPCGLVLPGGARASVQCRSVWFTGL